MTDTTLAGRVAIVTGAGQGLGRAYALGLAVAGATVVVADLQAANAERVAAEVAGAGGTAWACALDVADEASTRALAEGTLARYRRIDVLVNNAALFSTLALRPFEEIPLDEWDRVMATNVRGPFLCARAVAPAMKAQRYGKIVNVSSNTALMGRAGYLHYVTSKAAVIGMTRALARELGEHSITVNTLAPGAVLTEVPRQTFTAADVPAVAQATALRRGETPEDLVGVVVFLASPASDFMTGQTMTVDGGLVML